MAVEIIVSDTGPLISLEKMTYGYVLMEKLYGQILVPPRVAQELCQGMFSSWEAYQAHYGFGDFVSIVEVPNVKSYPGFEDLDGGEIESICLALERCFPLLIEEEQGRRVAVSLGLKISGIAGQVLKAYREKLISAAAAQARLAELLRAGCIGKRLYGGLVEALN
jgi:predicted nucleic acid-binding protein